MDLYDKKNVLSFCTTHCIPISDTIHKTQIPRKDVNQTCSISKKKSFFTKYTYFYTKRTERQFVLP